MKRQLHSTSPPSSPLSNSHISDDIEPAPKRPRIFISSPTPPPDDDNEIDIEDQEEEDEDSNTDDDDDEIIIDEQEPLIPSVTITEDSENENDNDDGENDIIEIEEENSNSFTQQLDNGIIFVSDSDSDDNSDDQGIDVTDDIVPSVSSIFNASISSPDIEDIEIVQEEIEAELTVMDEPEHNNDHDDHESLEIVNNDDDEDNNNNNNNELIDLTDDEPISMSTSSTVSERKLSTDVQQCPICLETLSHLQRTGVYLIITQCRHVMCTLCSRQLLATSSRCPLCRENVSSTTLMPFCILT